MVWTHALQGTLFIPAVGPSNSCYPQGHAHASRHPQAGCAPQRIGHTEVCPDASAQKGPSRYERLVHAHSGGVRVPEESRKSTENGRKKRETGEQPRFVRKRSEGRKLFLSRRCTRETQIPIEWQQGGGQLFQQQQLVRGTSPLQQETLQRKQFAARPTFQRAAVEPVAERCTPSESDALQDGGAKLHEENRGQHPERAAPAGGLLCLSQRNEQAQTAGQQTD